MDGLRRALDEERRLREAAEARASAFEVALFEERARSTQALARQREECARDAVDAAAAAAAEVAASRRRRRATRPAPAAAAAAAARDPGRQPRSGSSSRAVASAEDAARTAAPTWEEAIDVARSVGVGVLFKARQLRSHHGAFLGRDGGPLKETLISIAHPYGSPPPLSPADALASALACVDFAVVALPALLETRRDASAPLPPGADGGVFEKMRVAGAGLAAAVVAGLADASDDDDDLPRRPSLQTIVTDGGAVEEDDGTAL